MKTTTKTNIMFNMDTNAIINTRDGINPNTITNTNTNTNINFAVCTNSNANTTYTTS